MKTIANNRQLHHSERDGAKENKEKYQKYLEDKTGEDVTPEEAYQRLLSAGYAIVDRVADQSTLLDMLGIAAAPELAGNIAGTLAKFAGRKGTAAEVAGENIVGQDRAAPAPCDVEV
jgi:hypothetical protein